MMGCKSGCALRQLFNLDWQKFIVTIQRVEHRCFSKEIFTFTCTKNGIWIPFGRGAYFFVMDPEA